MDQKIDITTPDAIRSRLAPDIKEYMKLSDAEREAYDVRWKTYVERALYVLLTESQLDYAPIGIPELSKGDVAWLNRMAQFVVARRHNFEQPQRFGQCLSDKQFESVIRKKDGGDRISHFATSLSAIARSRGTEYNGKEAENEPEPKDAAANGTVTGSEALESADEAFGRVVKEAGRTRTTGRKPRR